MSRLLRLTTAAAVSAAALVATSATGAHAASSGLSLSAASFPTAVVAGASHQRFQVAITNASSKPSTDLGLELTLHTSSAAEATTVVSSLSLRGCPAVTHATSCAASYRPESLHVSGSTVVAALQFAAPDEVPAHGVVTGLLALGATDDATAHTVRAEVSAVTIDGTKVVRDDTLSLGTLAVEPAHDLVPSTRQTLSSPHRGQLRVRVTTSPHTAGVVVHFSAIHSDGSLHRLGPDAITDSHGVADVTFHKPAGRYSVVETVRGHRSGTKQVTVS